MFKYKSTLFFIFFLMNGIFFLKDQINCHELPKANNFPLVLDIPKAVSRVLNDNRELMETSLGLRLGDYEIKMANSDFNIQISPNSRAGYVGGGHEGTGWSVGGGIDITKKFMSGTQISIEPSILKFPKHYHTEIKAMISQPLLRGLGKEVQLSGIYAAQFSKRTACRNLYIAQIALILRTIQSLYEVAKAEKSLLLNQESYQRINKFYQAAKIKEKIGLSETLDVYRAETEWRYAEDALTNSQDRLQDAEDVLRELLALPLDIPLKVELPFVYTPNLLETEKAIQIALENRIEMEQEEDEWEEKKRLTRLAKKNISPELNFVLNYSNCGQNEIFTQACTRHRESTWGFGFTTTGDFNPLSERIVYEQSILALAAAERGFAQTEANLILEIKRTMRQLKRAHQRIILQEEQIQTSQGELHLVKLKFDRGMTDNFNVIQAEKNLRGANQTYWGAIMDHIVGEFQLLAAIGFLIDKPDIQH